MSYPLKEKIIQVNWISYFLRFSLAAGFLSAVADRFGLWPENVSAWGNWNNFVAYTGLINPLVPKSLVPVLGGIATGLEIVLALLLIVGYKTALAAKVSGVLLLLFALAMTFSTGIKGVLDYSVFTAAAAAFALAALSTNEYSLK